MRRRQSAGLATMAVVATLISACGGGAPGSPSSGSVALSQITPSPRENTVSALHHPFNTSLPKPVIDPSELIAGGPPPDGIPAIDHPRLEHPASAAWLHDREPVLALTLGADARAYPLQILTWHEIVNDTVDGVPVAVTFCPLCDSAIAFDRRLGGRVLDFGTSGMLYRSDLVMYDRQTETLWSQFIGTGIDGVLSGRQLRSVPVAIVAWSDWRSAHPGGWVLSRDTGYQRDYGTNPYVGYDDVHSPPFLFHGAALDNRYPPKTRVVGIRSGSASVAVLLDTLRQAHVLTVNVGGTPVVVWEKDGTASALDAASIADGRDVGATGAFSPIVDDRVLHFTRGPQGFTDAETGTTWNVLGAAIQGPLAGRQLQPIDHVDTLWFVWAAFLPATRVVTSASS